MRLTRERFTVAGLVPTNPRMSVGKGSGLPVVVIGFGEPARAVVVRALTEANDPERVACVLRRAADDAAAMDRAAPPEEVRVGPA